MELQIVVFMVPVEFVVIWWIVMIYKCVVT